MVPVSTSLVPIHPGEILLQDFLIPLQITQRELADAIRAPYRHINELVNKKRAVTPDMALRLARFLCVSAYFWLNLQIRWDLYKAEQLAGADWETVVDYRQWRKLA
jgi:addiction module HigA family antidote